MATMESLVIEARRLSVLAQEHKRQSAKHRRAAQAAMERRAHLITQLERLGMEVEFKANS